MKEKKKHSFSRVLQTIMRDIWHWDKGQYGMFLMTTVSMTVQSLVGIYLVKVLVDELTGQKRITVILLTVLVAAATQLAAALLGTIVQSKGWYRQVMIRVKYLFRRGSKLMRMPFQNTEDPVVLDQFSKSHRAVGDCISGCGAGMERYLGTLFNSGSYLLPIVSYLGLLVSFDWRLAVFIFLTVLGEYALNRWMAQQEHKDYEKMAPMDRRIMHYRESMVDAKSGKDIRLFGFSRFLLKQFDTNAEGMLKIQRRTGLKQMGCSAASVLINVVRYGVISLLLFSAMQKENLSLGDYSMLLAAATAFSGAMSTLVNGVAELFRQNLYLADYFEFMDLPEGTGDGEKVAWGVNTVPELEFRDVSFTYPGSDKPVLEHLNLKIPAGQRLALVGVNGAGKTTLIKLMTGLYRPTQGMILLDGRPMDSIDRSDWFELFSVVFQDVNLFAWTLAENISMCPYEQTDLERLNETIRLAGLTDWVDTLPQGIQTNLLRVLDEDGIEPSGGQAQKISLARAIYRDRPVVILDEPTAALDPLAEAQVYTSFDKLLRDKSGVYVSHRLSSTRFCDIVAYLEEGHIVEYGSHDELMAMDGRYAVMFQKQASYYQQAESEGRGEPYEG